MTIKIIRVVFVFACITMGGLWGNHLVDTFNDYNPETGTAMFWRITGLVLGGGVGVGFLFLLSLITQEIFERLFPVVIAIALAMMLGYFVARLSMLFLPPEDITIHVFTTSTLLLLFGFGGISLGLTKASNWESLLTAVKKQNIEYGNPKIVDTSVIIDGRIADIATTGFLEGTLIIPRFVLKELQNIADSSDMLRRAKGRRGLDILKAMQDGGGGKLKIDVVDADVPGVSEVDGKIVALAKEYGAKIITNDYNLNKVAQIEGVPVLNINDLANALKPAVLPDERIEVKIVKEGKEAYQGVGYLDDGTMIVVDGGREFVGKEVSVLVTSVLQTAAGRMIFTKLSEVLSRSQAS